MPSYLQYFKFDIQSDFLFERDFGTTCSYGFDNSMVSLTQELNLNLYTTYRYKGSDGYTHVAYIRQ